MKQIFQTLNFIKKLAAKTGRGNFTVVQVSLLKHLKATLPVLLMIGISLLLNHGIRAQGPVFTGDAGNLSNIVREGLKLMAILLFCGGAFGIAWAIFNKMTGKEWGSQAFGGILAFAFGTIVAVFWQIAQGRAVTVDTNF